VLTDPERLNALFPSHTLLLAHPISQASSVLAGLSEINPTESSGHIYGSTLTLRLMRCAEREITEIGGTVV
jgi:hypothetical protein